MIRGHILEPVRVQTESKTYSILIVLCLVFVSSLGFAQSDGNLRFLKASVYSDLRQSLRPPPATDSKEQQEDEQEIIHLQRSRKSSDCRRAESEIEATLGNFYGRPNGPLTKAQVDHLNDFFKILRNEAAAFIGKLKEEYPRRRPYQYMKGISPCIKKETSNSYPSGHAIFAELYSRVLTDLFPNEKAEINARDETIGKDRVLTGLHYPSDVRGGRRVGRMIYEELKKSKSYQEAFAKIKQALYSESSRISR